MLDSMQKLLTSQHPWSALTFLLVGAVLGAVISMYLTVRAQRPRLVINGGGGGGNDEKQSWSISIVNRPAFFGTPFAGEPAKDLNALLTPKKKRSSKYILFWSSKDNRSSVAIEPGTSQNLEVFTWFAKDRGAYCILDGTGEPIARFVEPELEFKLEIRDRFGRSAIFAFKVKFDDSHMKHPARLNIAFPMTLEARLRAFKKAMHVLSTVFRIGM